jgi:hypothetical protein
MNAPGCFTVRRVVTISRKIRWTLLSMFVGMVLVIKAASVPGEFRITSISISGTNLILTALIPSGIKQVKLEMHRTIEAAWSDLEQWDVAAGGGEMQMTFPRPAWPMCFFRLRAVLPMENSQPAVSSELGFVTAGSLASNTSNGDAVFHFKGRVDGSDRILIKRDGALWEHVNWGWPEGTVAINGTEWNPADKNYLTTSVPGTFLPETFSLAGVRLEIIQGRDVVALERTNDALVVYVNDTLPGPSDYEFNLYFPAVQPVTGGVASSTSARLKIAAQIDGSDAIKITALGATWTHGSFGVPANVTVNEIPWNLGQTNVLANAGGTAFLPAGVDFSTAKIVKRKGRDLATAWGDKDALEVHFADNPNGSDDYEIEILFGAGKTGK